MMLQSGSFVSVSMGGYRTQVAFQIVLSAGLVS